MKLLLLMAAIGVFAGQNGNAQEYEKDIIPTSGGALEITFLGHATMMLQFNGTVIHVDPVSAEADYANLPKAGLILVTHDHGDHFDPKAITQVYTDKTAMVWTATCAEKAGAQFKGQVMKNGDTATVQGIPIEAVPAYNIQHLRSPGNPYHPKGIGNGYVLTFGDTRVYIAGDTENTPELKALKSIAVAFLPVNLPYTMDVDMAADAALSIRPRILYPYHYGETDLAPLVKLLAEEKGIEIRIRKME